MSLLSLCFEGLGGFAELSIGGITRAHRKWVPCSEMFERGPSEAEAQSPYYFGPAMRKRSGVMGKANCVGSSVCWVDADYEDLPLPLLPATAVVWSGHGWHLYWRLEDFCMDIARLEATNKVLAVKIGGDGAHNVDRLLRMPGSINTKSAPYVPCKLVQLRTYEYALSTLVASTHVAPKAVHKAVTGDSRGYRSRSERDLAIVRALVAAQLEDSAIHTIFDFHACGDRYREANGKEYLARTIKKARATAHNDTDKSTRSIVEQDSCYYIRGRGGLQQVSTFTIEPTMLLMGSSTAGMGGLGTGEDSVMGDVRTSGVDYVWKDVIFPRSAFSGISALNRHLTKASWVWLGRDSDVRLLLAYLMSQLIEAGVPRAYAVSTIGVVRLPAEEADSRTFFVANDAVMASDGSLWYAGSLKAAPLVYVASKREAPELDLLKQLDGKALGTELLGLMDARMLAELLPRLNTDECIWPILGWFMAAPLKDALHHLEYRFPVLNITGTRGAGKSTLVLRVFQRLLGYKTPVSYDSSTTRFVTLALLGSTNAIPIAFSEFRAAMSTDFLRYVLLAYDTGRDARGRADQTTVSYNLTAPFVLDGEDRVDDPAALERVAAVVLSPRTVAEGEPAWAAFQKLTGSGALALDTFALSYLRHTLTLDVAATLDAAEQDVYEAFSMQLPSRIRQNITVCWLGILSWAAFMQTYDVPDELLMPAQGAGVLDATLNNVYSARLKRAPTAADAFVEYVVNAAAQGAKSFPWKLQVPPEGGAILRFQLTPAFESFVSYRARQRRGTLTRNAIRGQLRELLDDYTEEPVVMDLKGRKALAYGVDLVRACEAGLDVPRTFTHKSFTITL